MSIGRRLSGTRLAAGRVAAFLLCCSVFFWGWQGVGAPLSVVATVGMVADLARGVGGEDVVVQGLMGPGVDPHLYKATSSDLIRLQRAATVKEELKALHQWVLDRVASVPTSRRILVTSHDAFGYFGKAYGFQVVALQGVSTVTEAGLADMAQLTDFIRSKGVPAVFVESSVSHASLERIRKDAGVKLGGELFSDAMGTPGQQHGGYDLGTYQGMIRQNVDRIVEGLK